MLKTVKMGILKKVLKFSVFYSSVQWCIFFDVKSYSRIFKTKCNSNRATRLVALLLLCHQSSGGCTLLLTKHVLFFFWGVLGIKVKIQLCFGLLFHRIFLVYVMFSSVCLLIVVEIFSSRGQSLCSGLIWFWCAWSLGIFATLLVH